MSEVIIYRSKIEQATDTALFELMSAEWMFPLIVAASVAFLFLMVTEKWFDTMCMKEKQKHSRTRGSDFELYARRAKIQKKWDAKIQKKWDWIQYGSAGFLAGVVFYTMMSKIS